MKDIIAPSRWSVLTELERETDFLEVYVQKRQKSVCWTEINLDRCTNGFWTVTPERKFTVLPLVQPKIVGSSSTTHLGEG